MKLHEEFYIGGRWIRARDQKRIELINPADERPCGGIAVAMPHEVDAAVQAAKTAFPRWSSSTVAERVSTLHSIAAGIAERGAQIAESVTMEMGIPRKLAHGYQAEPAQMIFSAYAQLLESYSFERAGDLTTVLKEPIGVCGLITPWNFPLTQIALKLAPALAAGCTIVLKPSEFVPTAAVILAQVIDNSGLPAGVFNLIHGDGATTGAALCAHPAVDMVSITGSTRAGAAVTEAAAASIKRVTQELGGKSPYLILDDADLETDVIWGVQKCFANSGQACDAPTRMLVPARLYDRAIAFARSAAEKLVVGDPTHEATDIGPLANRVQFQKVQRLIREAVGSGATLVTGGVDGAAKSPGYFVQPTIFGNVDPSSAIAQEEIFGPVLCIIPYRDEDEAVRIANDSRYGLAAFISGRDSSLVERIARRLRCGQVRINRSPFDIGAPFGGYKWSGNGRECGTYGLEEYLETKACMGLPQLQRRA